MAENTFDSILRPLGQPEGGFPRNAEDRRKTERVVSARTRDEFVKAMMEEHGVTRIQAESVADYAGRTA